MAVTCHVTGCCCVQAGGGGVRDQRDGRQPEGEAARGGEQPAAPAAHQGLARAGPGNQEQLAIHRPREVYGHAQNIPHVAAHRQLLTVHDLSAPNSIQVFIYRFQIRNKTLLPPSSDVSLLKLKMSTLEL